MTKTNFSQPNTLYIPSIVYPWFVSKKQGLCKAVPFKLKFVSSSKKRMDLVLTAAKLTGFKGFGENTRIETMWLNYLNSVDEIVIAKNKNPYPEIVAPDRKALYKAEWVGVYKIVGRNIKNTQRACVEKRAKKTKDVRKKAATCDAGRAYVKVMNDMRANAARSNVGRKYVNAVNNVKNVKHAKAAIKKAFEFQQQKKGLCFVEIVSNCNSGWKMTPVQANKWMEENMFPNYPIGDIKVDGKIAEGIDVNRLVLDHALEVVNK